MGLQRCAAASPVLIRETLVLIQQRVALEDAPLHRLPGTAGVYRRTLTLMEGTLALTEKTPALI